MLSFQQEDCSYLAFSDLLTGYRLSFVLMLAHDAGVFDAINREGAEGPELCAGFGWEPGYGERFLRCLCNLGLLKLQGARYILSPFAATYLCSKSVRYQGKTLAFEKQLFKSWEGLAACLEAGKRVFATEDKEPQELQQAFSTYLGSMDEVGCIRAEELWNCFPAAATSGNILDIGAGSGAFISDFLQRNPGWRGIFCDLPEVVSDSELHSRLAEIGDRITWCGCDLLAEPPLNFDAITERSCDVALLSNIIHCQGAAETDILLGRAAAKTRERGVLVIHDFFSDTGWRGALYDLHMMLNTFNGKTYTLREIVEMAAAYGLCHSCFRQLHSGSTALVLAREPETLVSFADFKILTQDNDT